MTGLIEEFSKRNFEIKAMNVPHLAPSITIAQAYKLIDQ